MLSETTLGYFYDCKSQKRKLVSFQVASNNFLLERESRTDQFVKKSKVCLGFLDAGGCGTSLLCHVRGLQLVAFRLHLVFHLAGSRRLDVHSFNSSSCKDLNIKNA